MDSPTNRWMNHPLLRRRGIIYAGIALRPSRLPRLVSTTCVRTTGWSIGGTVPWGTLLQMRR